MFELNLNMVTNPPPLLQTHITFALLFLQFCLGLSFSLSINTCFFPLVGFSDQNTLSLILLDHFFNPLILYKWKNNFSSLKNRKIFTFEHSLLFMCKTNSHDSCSEISLIVLSFVNFLVQPAAKRVRLEINCWFIYPQPLFNRLKLDKKAIEGNLMMFPATLSAIYSTQSRKSCSTNFNYNFSCYIQKSRSQRFVNKFIVNTFEILSRM